MSKTLKRYESDSRLESVKVSNEMEREFEDGSAGAHGDVTNLSGDIIEFSRRRE